MFISEIKELGRWISVIVLIAFYLYGWSWVIIDVTKNRKDRGNSGEDMKMSVVSAIWFIFHILLLIAYFAYCWTE